MADENFETKLKKLEKIVAELEASDTDIDKMVKLFEDGVKLSKECRTQLDSIALKIKDADEK